ncbi:MAG TPA: alpha/beta hydrolase [Stellaceae bacterium]|nr:alpha/beta hydrolase [Stellaceae bacterium]
MAQTIVFVHGAWVTPACWQSFKTFFEQKGYTCLTPHWPYIDRPVEQLNLSIDPAFAKTTVKSLTDHYAAIIRSLPEPPILIGHSFGGLIVQLLLDRGLGARGAAIEPGNPSGVLPSLAAVLAAAPVLLTWSGWSKVCKMSFHGFATTFANTLPKADMRRVYETQIVPAPGRIYFQAALGIGTSLNFKNPDRPPLLLISADKDKTASPSMIRAMYRRHKASPVRVDFQSFKGLSHWLIAEPGWEAVATAIWNWAQE